MTTIGIIASQLLTTQQQPFWWNKVAYTRKRFIDALQQAGANVVLLAIDKPEKAAEQIKIVDKILLTGGTDVDPRFYGEEPDVKLEGVDPDRDAYEIAVVKAAIAADKPILGVCRGLQVMNVALGGTIWQDLSYYDGAIKHRQATTPQDFDSHSVVVKRDSLLGFLPEKYYVDSYHHQAVKQVASALTVIATASDGVVEAAENREKRLLGVQWHPECDYRTHPYDYQIFEYFVNEL